MSYVRLIYFQCPRDIFFEILVPGCFYTNTATKYMLKVISIDILNDVLNVFKASNAKINRKRIF